MRFAIHHFSPRCVRGQSFVFADDRRGNLFVHHDSEVTNPPCRAPRTATVFAVPAMPARGEREYGQGLRRKCRRAAGSAIVRRDFTLGIDMQAADRTDGSFLEERKRFGFRSIAPVLTRELIEGRLDPMPDECDPRTRAARRVSSIRGSRISISRSLTLCTTMGAWMHPVAARELFGQFLRKAKPVDLGIPGAQPAVELNDLHTLEGKGPPAACCFTRWWSVVPQLIPMRTFSFNKRLEQSCSRPFRPAPGSARRMGAGRTTTDGGKSPYRSRRFPLAGSWAGAGGSHAAVDEWRCSSRPPPPLGARWRAVDVYWPGGVGLRESPS